ncbi:29260_t:CDS:1, partial [Racocetra persica]
ILKSPQKFGGKHILEENNNEYFINKIEFFKKRILSEMEKDDKNLWIEYMNHHREKYLLECISTKLILNTMNYKNYQKVA